MTRLIHSYHGFHRYMQMSTNTVFIFVEGKIIDPYFYGKIADDILTPNGTKYTVVRADEISNIGGKPGLISYFKFLRRKSFLNDNFNGKKTCSIFYLDKDIDDILNKTIQSPHLAYTTYFDVFNHIFLEGNLAKAIPVTISIDPNYFNSKIRDCCTLRNQLAISWKDWVKLCIYTEKKKIGCMVNYRVISKVNDPSNNSFNQSLYDDFVRELKLALNYDDKQFKISFNRVSKMVDNLYINGNKDYVFKGKWYCFLFSQHLKQLFNKSDCNGLDNRLSSDLILTLDFNQVWAEHFKQPLRQLIQNL